MDQLTKLDLRGFKTIRTIDSFELKQLNVLIGATGAGKSNFISFFRLLNWMVGNPPDLQFYVGRAGGASSLLHDGPAVTQFIESRLEFLSDQKVNEYAFRV